MKLSWDFIFFHFVSRSEVCLYFMSYFIISSFDNRRLSSFDDDLNRIEASLLGGAMPPTCAVNYYFTESFMSACYFKRNAASSCIFSSSLSYWCFYFSSIFYYFFNCITSSFVDANGMWNIPEELRRTDRAEPLAPTVTDSPWTATPWCSDTGIFITPNCSLAVACYCWR